VSLGRRSVLITGAGGGIGRAIARTLANDGFRIFLNSRHSASLQAVADEISMSGGDVAMVPGDITIEQDRRDVFSKLDNPLFGFVHAACPPLEEMWFSRTSLDHLRKHWALAVEGPAALLQLILPSMAAAREGSIVWILTSAVIGRPPRELSAYVSAKMAALGLLRCLAVEYAAKGIRVNGVSPGLVPTSLTSEVPQQIIELYKKGVPMGRLATSEDVAAAVRYFLSADSCFVTGSNLPVTGGTSFL
jgi:NAD(P)-dependent dehydrogenase (short-subunit alcohol dehydrogenase family)